MTRPKSQKKFLQVPNAPNCREFLTAAREVWDKHHKPQKPGPDAEKNRKQVFTILNKAFKDQKVTPDTSLEKLTDCVERQVGIYPHRETIYKYAKMWRFQQRKFKLSQKDCSWIQKHSTEFFEELKKFKQRECQVELRFIGGWFGFLRATRRRPDLNNHNTFEWEKDHFKRIKEEFLDLGFQVLGKGLYRKLRQNLSKLKPLIYDSWE